MANEAEIPDHRPAFFAVSASFFCLFLYYSFFARFMVLVFTQYGLDAREIGLIALLGIFASIPSSSLWGIIADRTGKRKLVIACCITMAVVAQTLLCLTPLIESHTGRVMYCCVICVVYTMCRGNDYGQLRGMAMRTLDRCKRPAAYGTLRLWGAVSWGIAHPLLGWMLDVEHGDLTLLYVGNFVAAMLAVGCMSLLLRSDWTDEPSTERESPEAHADLWDLIRLVCSKPEMLSWLLCAAAQAMGMQHVSQFLFLYMEERFHSTDILMGLSVTVTVIFEVPIFAFGEYLLPKLGPTGLIAIAMGSFAIRVFGYTIVPTAPWMLVLEPLHGVTYACFTLATVHYMNDHVPMHMISTAQGFMSSVAGAGSAFGAILGGWVMVQPSGGLLLFRSDTVIMFVVLFLFILSQIKCKRTRAPLLEAGGSVRQSELGTSPQGSGTGRDP